MKTLTKKDMVDTKFVPHFTTLPLCEGCIMGKQHKIPFPKASQSNSTKILELVHSNVCGPIQTTSFGGAKYFTLFIDDFSRYYHLKYKLEVFMKFEEYKTLVEKKTQKMIKILRMDNGGEYDSLEF